MLDPLMIGIDLVAITVLTLPLYFRRHRRRDLVTAFAVLNVAVMAVATILGQADIGMGVGLGLFGVLSIIRLRSSEITQHEVAYYFSALSIGLIAGLNATQTWVSVALIALILGIVACVDSPKLLPRSRGQKMRLDRAFTTDQELKTYLSQLLNGQVMAVTVLSVDLVNDSTLVDVRWREHVATKPVNTQMKANSVPQPPVPGPAPMDSFQGAPEQTAYGYQR